MLTLLDGPATGQALCCARAPLFLHVVRDAGTWDALDQLGDTPQPDEAVLVYVKAEAQGTVHYSGRDRHGRAPVRAGSRRWEQCATYRLCETQPEDATVRDTEAWRQWCLARQAERSQDS